MVKKKRKKKVFLHDPLRVHLTLSDFIEHVNFINYPKLDNTS